VLAGQHQVTVRELLGHVLELVRGQSALVCQEPRGMSVIVDAYDVVPMHEEMLVGIEAQGDDHAPASSATDRIRCVVFKGKVPARVKRRGEPLQRRFVSDVDDVVSHRHAPMDHHFDVARRGPATDRGAITLPEPRGPASTPKP
jgi:hypothetical protein